jgi:D-lactate dehydrogenase
MRIALYGCKPYDRIFFEPLSQEYGCEMIFIEDRLSHETIPLAGGCDAVCLFVNESVTADIVRELEHLGVRAILLRCAGYNHVDLSACAGRMKVYHVPSYSPEAVAEFAAAQLLCVNRRLHRAYNRTRDFNMSISGLMGITLHGKCAGVVGTGRIGQAMIRILKGFGMEVIAYDLYPNAQLGVEYVSLKDLCRQADVISLHCPLTKETHHMLDGKMFEQMKKGVYLVNTSRGGLINTADLIEALKKGTFGGVALDVYEEEEGLFYEDRSDDIVRDDNLARLMTFPNVLITSHQGFFTMEAMRAIAITTLENAKSLELDRETANEVTIKEV